MLKALLCASHYEPALWRNTEFLQPEFLGEKITPEELQVLAAGAKQGIYLQPEQDLFSDSFSEPGLKEGKREVQYGWEGGNELHAVKVSSWQGSSVAGCPA